MPLKYSLFTLKIASFRNGLVGLEIVGYQLYTQNYDDFCLEVTIFKVFFFEMEHGGYIQILKTKFVLTFF